jgi:CheY-like chemotaxis protein
VRAAEAARARAEEESRAQAAIAARQAAELATRPATQKRPAPALGGGEAPLAPTGLRGKRALCAVADEASLSRLTALLSRWGLKARGARDGYQGLELVREGRAAGTPFQVVIIDAEVPGLDGASLGRLLREDAALGEAPLLLLQAAGAPAEDGVFAATLRKPVDPAELAACLQGLLRPSAS